MKTQREVSYNTEEDFFLIGKQSKAMVTTSIRRTFDCLSKVIKITET